MDTSKALAALDPRDLLSFERATLSRDVVRTRCVLTASGKSSISRNDERRGASFEPRSSAFGLRCLRRPGGVDRRSPFQSARDSLPGSRFPGGLKGRGRVREARRRKQRGSLRLPQAVGAVRRRPRGTAGPSARSRGDAARGHRNGVRSVVRKTRRVFRHHERASLSRTTANRATGAGRGLSGCCGSLRSDSVRTTRTYAGSF